MLRIKRITVLVEALDRELRRAQLLNHARLTVMTRSAAGHEFIERRVRIVAAFDGHDMIDGDGRLDALNLETNLAKRIGLQLLPT